MGIVKIRRTTATTTDLGNWLDGKLDSEIENQLRKSQADYFTVALENKTYIAWYAIVNNEVVGIGGLCVRQQPGNIKNLSGKVGYIFSMYTNPKYRKKGICSNILNRLIETANTMGISAFELHATKEGEPVYAKNGFLIFNEPTYRKYI